MDLAVRQTQADRLADEELGATRNDARVDRDRAHRNRAAAQGIVARRPAAAGVIEAGRGAPVGIAGHQLKLFGRKISFCGLDGTGGRRGGFQDSGVACDGDVIGHRLSGTGEGRSP
ncbi:hypothetical protein D3C73_1101310 [compost metagenome]